MPYRIPAWGGSRAPAALSIVAGYFVISGIVAFIGTTLQVAAVLSGTTDPRVVGPGPMYTAIIGGGMGTLWVLAGILLWRRNRLGALLALASLLLDVVQWFWDAPSLTDLLFFLAVLALVTVSWRVLDPGHNSGIP
jgi:hypothetical protein